MNHTKNALPPLIPVAEALTRLLEDVRATPSFETVPLYSAVNRILAEACCSSVDVPPQDNSSMDGYALHSDSVKDLSTALVVSQRITAGTAPQPLQEGTAARIFTGAEVPVGANAVVMQEQAVEEDGRVRFEKPVSARQNIRPRGQDIQAQAQLFTPGKLLQAADLGVLASAGLASVSVYRPLKVAILSTGDELVEPGDEILPGQIYNSNRAVLTALVGQLGMELVDLGRVADTFEATKAALARAAEQADLVISTGGVSVGEEDHIKSAVEALGALNLWRIKLKPGKPLAYGRVGDVPFFGLPGNPASALITFCLFAKPYLMKLQGAEVIEPMRFKVEADFEHRRAGAREEYMRGIYSQGKVRVFSNQSSGMLSTASRANGLIVIAPDAVIARGESVDFIPFSELIAR
ncbi:MAG: gephyrin-like molybdotransferase Glp [Pseudomonadales bacterium]